jgi:protein-S-isoprenylcysteine O-methyltransferase Ste14
MIVVVRWLVFAAWLAWIGYYWSAGRRAVADLKKARQPDRSPLDARLMATMGLMTIVIGLGALAINCGVLEIGAAPDGLVVAGGALTLIGMSGTLYCRSILGRFWTAETTVKPDHQIVDRGPYGVVRHPIYLAASAQYLGTALVFPAWWLIAAALVVIVSYGLKANLEDEYLARTLAGYTDYRRRVKYRLLPGVW